jgi:hypothetical protein
MRDIDLGLLTTEDLGEAARWLNSVTGLPGGKYTDPTEITLANLRFDAGELDAWAKAEAPRLLRGIERAIPESGVPLDVLFPVALAGAVNFGAICVLKALQDTNEAGADV